MNVYDKLINWHFVEFEGMAISTYSYCDKVRICVTSDSKLFETQAQLKAFIRSIEDGLSGLAKYYNIGEVHKKTEGWKSKPYHLNNNQQYQFSDKFNVRRLSATRCITKG